MPLVSEFTSLCLHDEKGDKVTIVCQMQACLSSRFQVTSLGTANLFYGTIFYLADYVDLYIVPPFMCFQTLLFVIPYYTITSVYFSHFNANKFNQTGFLSSGNNIC